MSKTKAQPEITNDGGFLTYQDGEVQRCLGYLMHFKGHGVYDADLGRVDVTPEQADIHNRLFDAANIAGLDRCAVGQYGIFYPRDEKVFTWIGTEVAPMRQVGKTCTFTRNGMTFRGRRGSNDSVRFRRVS